MNRKIHEENYKLFDQRIMDDCFFRDQHFYQKLEYDVVILFSFVKTKKDIKIPKGENKIGKLYDG